VPSRKLVVKGNKDQEVVELELDVLEMDIQYTRLYGDGLL
jgi:hypothetical protein